MQQASTLNTIAPLHAVHRRKGNQNEAYLVMPVLGIGGHPVRKRQELLYPSTWQIQRLPCHQKEKERKETPKKGRNP